VLLYLLEGDGFFPFSVCDVLEEIQQIETIRRLTSTRVFGVNKSLSAQKLYLWGGKERRYHSCLAIQGGEKEHAPEGFSVRHLE